jgi:ribose 5-phosphate isomerase RpiB
MVSTWLKTPFEGGRHARRVAKIMELERYREVAAERKE